MLKTLARFAHHLAGHRRALAALFVLGLVGAGVSLATPLLGKAFIDAVATRGDYSLIPAIAAGMVALSLLDLALAIVAQRVHARLSADVLAALRAALFRRCVSGPLEAIEPIRHGDLLTRFGTDLPHIQTLLVDGLLGALQSLLFLAVAAAITFTLSPPLALWSFLGVALALAAAASFRRAVEARSTRVREAVATLSHFLAERLGALRAIRLQRTQAEEAQALTQANATLTREVVGLQVLDAASTGVPGLVLTLALAWIYLLGGRLLESSAITLGTFFAFVLYQGRLFAPAQGLLGLIRNLQSARISVERVSEVLGSGAENTTPTPSAPASLNSTALAPASASAAASAAAAASPSATATTTADNADGDTATNAAIVFSGVHFAYAGKPPVLDGVDLHIRRGERIALLGASGVGKSTVVQLLFGLRQPSAGRILIDGVDAATQTRALGYAGAEPFLLHASVEDNLRYGNPEASRAAIERALHLADAEDFVASLPAGLQTIIGGRGLTLSDGQRQRLGLARLFLQNPQILVLDEAFCALDIDTERRIRSHLWQAFTDRTALVISHRAVGYDEFDRLLVVRDGGIEHAGAHSQTTTPDSP